MIIHTFPYPRRYRWGADIEALGGPFDLALASDLTYEPAAHGAPARL